MNRATRIAAVLAVVGLIGAGCASTNPAVFGICTGLSAAQTKGAVARGEQTTALTVVKQGVASFVDASILAVVVKEVDNALGDDGGGKTVYNTYNVGGDYTGRDKYTYSGGSTNSP